MKRLSLIAALCVASPALGVADLFPTQSNETSQAAFCREGAYTIETDTVGSGSTSGVIVATNTARKGDVLRFLAAGSNYYAEAHVLSATSSQITLKQSIPVAPTAGDTFLVMRLITPGLSAAGLIPVTGAVAPTVTYSFADSARNDYSSTSVTTGAWVELIASMATSADVLTLFDSSGQTLELGTGAAASETRLLLIPPGGLSGPIGATVPAGTRISVRAVSGTASTGEIDLTLFHAATGTPASHLYADSKRNVYSSTNVTSGAWVQMIASTAQAATAFTLFDSSGQTLELGVGPLASETRVALVVPGGTDGQTLLNIPAGSRISLRAISATANTGEFDLTLFQ